MALKYQVDTLDGVDAAHHALYVEKDGKFTLAVEGAVPKARLDEFRDTNLTLRQQMDALTAKFDGVDPEVYRALSDKAQKERDRKLIDAGKVDELVAERIGAMKVDHEKQVGSVKSELEKARAQLETLVIDNAIRDAAGKAGVRPTAVDDVLLRGRSLFRLQDGKAIPMDGEKPIFGKSGEPMEIGEWVGSLTATAPHLFASSGGDAGRGTGTGGTGTVVDRNDKKAFLANLDAIASGKLRVA